MSIKITIDLARSPHVVLDDKNTVELVKCLFEETGGTRDLEETLRIVKNFDEYYRFSKRKFEEYITPQKDHREVVLGRAVVHKLRLFMEDNNRKVELIFDRRFDIKVLENCLKNIGFKEIVIEKQLF